MDAQGAGWGLLSLSTQVGTECLGALIGIHSGVQMGCLSCLRDRQDDSGEHLKVAGMGSDFIGVGHEVDQEIKVGMLWCQE